MTTRLFCYGTLEYPEVIRAVISDVPTSVPAVLHGFARYRLRDKEYPAIVPISRQKVSGTLYENVSGADLRQLDRFEGQEYKRCRVRVAVGYRRVNTWVYVLRAEFRNRLTRYAWDHEARRQRVIACYGRKGGCDARRNRTD